ncbi:MAG TPA: DUF4981 domain-containing protein, partial [Prolixibacteraceae bacterium]|nr:DUF4981 domain-containing protein [Prolixibacteraceae bacterium]
YGGNDYDAPGHNPVECEDIIGPRYGTPFQLKTDFGQSPEEIDPRPSFMDEYLAATGNSLGGLDEYWEVIYRYPRLMGGAIWDFVSPGLREKYISTPDSSGNNLDAALMGKTNLVPGKSGKAVQLTGTDTWIEFYRDPLLDISGKALTLSFWVKPGPWNGNGTFLSKGFYQFGIEQVNEKEIEFFVGDRKKTGVKTSVPGNWTGFWHLVTGVFNGAQLQLYIDGELKASVPCTLTIENKPFPVNIGRNPEIEAQENPHHYSNAAFDQVAIFNKAINPADLLNPSAKTKSEAVCWLDFDVEKTGPEFFSMGVGGRTYGTIWPDRTPQPEMWQIKKSAQPVSVQWRDEKNGEMEVWNRMHFSNTSELDAVWQLQEEGKVIQEGKLVTAVPALGKEGYTIPFQPFDRLPGKEYFLLVSFRLKEDKSWADAGFEVAWDQLPFAVLPEPKEIPDSVLPAPEVRETSDLVRVIGNGFTYTFSKKTGGLTSIWFQGRELLKQEPELNLWRAPLANDLDSWTIWRSGLSRTPGMGNGQSNAWFALGLDQMTTLADFIEWSVKNGNVVLNVESHTCNPGRSTCFDNRFVYTISGDGKMRVDHTVTPQGKMPEWLPRVGLQLVLDSTFNRLEWYGRGPFETYPDRKTGAKLNVWSGLVRDQYVPYLIPQENGNKSDVRWFTLKNGSGKGIRISGEAPFNFSALQVESGNLSRALYPFQLKPFDGITLNLDYALSGVGCTAISVLNAYRVAPSVKRFQWVLELLDK